MTERLADAPESLSQSSMGPSVLGGSKEYMTDEQPILLPIEPAEAAAFGTDKLPLPGLAEPPLLDAERRELEANLEAHGHGPEDVANIDPELARLLLQEPRWD